MGRNKQPIYWDIIAANCILNALESDIRFNISNIVRDENLSMNDYLKLRKSFNKILDLFAIKLAVEFNEQKDLDKYTLAMQMFKDKLEHETWGDYLRRKKVETQLKVN